ncbi:glycosyltransferase [methanotrophic endosymbiont of Bathymodiolus puteoserpentis (Logatchev)]|jgi:glycosyltransferase involved in cell wall biosynthesis|uniref:glycosyltransferase n=1 Tax=methanotrophic endosymbiont of Bathymodiolus puteoserpentis (Logatchev) TaxID=343235 RepID=UPI0013C7FDA2|nr:glycosyltransferase [methanotrophic endosymbiont of Bathymodiolus puteoserpentis (Logatchev)]SHE23205.1 probable glycosyl transferase [methanotrophic endosymbiont of Bathymodiolus puteoserpentis (Logatchev)]
MKKLTICLCSYNRSERLPKLIQALRAQASPIPFEILIIDNNSTDNTQAVIAELIKLEGAPLRTVIETQQGIPFARNRAIEECMQSDYMLFIDDDELPWPKTIESAIYSLDIEGAECVGGRVNINFGSSVRPAWLEDKLLPFFAAIDYGNTPFWITNSSTPVWTSIIAYRMTLFRNNPKLRFDSRYNRKGKGIGGGEDGIMFQQLLQQKVKIRYQPDMAVDHFIEDWKIRRSYFLKLHFIAGRKYGQFQMENYARTILGVPPFMLPQLFQKIGKTLGMFLRSQPGVLREAMNASHALGSIYGKFLARHEKQTH